MGQSLWFSPVIMFGLFMALAYALYAWSGRIAASSEETPGKHQPYASGEDLPLPKTQPAYHSFFRLALLFGILHLATLVVSTLPPGGGAKRTAFAYLLALAVSVFVLTKGDD